MAPLVVATQLIVQPTNTTSHAVNSKSFAESWNPSCNAVLSADPQFSLGTVAVEGSHKYVPSSSHFLHRRLVTVLYPSYEDVPILFVEHYFFPFGTARMFSDGTSDHARSAVRRWWWWWCRDEPYKAGRWLAYGRWDRACGSHELGGSRGTGSPDGYGTDEPRHRAVRTVVEWTLCAASLESRAQSDTKFYPEFQKL